MTDYDIEKMKKILSYYSYNETSGCDNPPMGLIISPKKTILVSYKKNNEFLLEENNTEILSILPLNPFWANR